MKVKELIDLLGEFNPESEALGLRSIDEPDWKGVLTVCDVRTFYRNDSVDEEKIYAPMKFIAAAHDAAVCLAECDVDRNDPEFNRRVDEYVDAFTSGAEEVAVIKLA